MTTDQTEEYQFDFEYKLVPNEHGHSVLARAIPPPLTAQNYWADGMSYAWTEWKPPTEWMCDLCFKEDIEIGMIAPGLALCKSGDTYYGLGGQGHTDDEEFWFTKKPMPDPTFLLTDEEEEEWYAEEANQPIWDEWFAEAQNAIKWHHGDPVWGYDLVSACIEAGYDRRKHGYFDYWLFHTAGELIETWEYRRGLI